MNFVSADYAAFLVLVFTAWWSVRAFAVPRLLLLLCSSLFFYGYWSWNYVPLLLGSTVVDYLLARAIAGTAIPGRKRLLLTFSLVVNLGVLAAFKYWGFFAENLLPLGIELPVLDVLLPPGISFYTFQSLSYTIDVYRGKLAPARNLLEFSVYIAYFPQLVAGPIVRASDFLPQFTHLPRIDQADLQVGLAKICCGLVKKVLIADTLAVGLVDPTFAAGSNVGGISAWLAIYAYALQIYGDFSGYSDIAIGSARLFGFRIQENFDAPYRARNVQDFWRRWHISLSTWLREYLYIPLGGNRFGSARTMTNVMVTMLLSGLWHGAAWKFVAWGGIHGLGLLWNRLWQSRGWMLRGRLGHLAAVVLTAHFAALAFVPFRAPDIAHAGDLLLRVVRGGDRVAIDPSLALAFALGVTLHLLPRTAKQGLVARAQALPAFAFGALLALVLGLVAARHQGGVPFIYFQF